jgi:hypothetical protein
MEGGARRKFTRLSHYFILLRCVQLPPHAHLKRMKDAVEGGEEPPLAEYGVARKLDGTDLEDLPHWTIPVPLERSKTAPSGYYD